MNNTLKLRLLQAAAAAAGLLGLLLRTLLYTTGIDEKGLLIRSHWACTGLWTLTFLICLILALACRRVPLFRRSAVSPLGALGCFLCAGALGMEAFARWGGAEGTLELLTLIFNAAAALALTYTGICRLTRKQPLYLAHGILCLCFALRMVGQYQTWSSDPQLMDYLFLMIAHVGLMLTSYHLAAFDAGLGRPKALWFLGPVTAYLCMVSLCRAENPSFLAFCALWVLTNLPEPARKGA